jgi:bifunctional DNA-binding transcriptional regulator/antitoxin component of YhaV-PrlF toxin-antitoxin module
MHFELLLDSGKEAERMKTLNVTERGQVTFRKEMLQYLGIRPGEKIE